MMPAGEATPTLTSWLLFSRSQDTQRSNAIAAARLRELAPYAAILVLPDAPQPGTPSST
jgi:hypothetical protein